MRIDEYGRIYALEDSHWWYLGQRRIFTELLNGYYHKEKWRILDAGCGTGGSLKMLERWGKVKGCDSSPEAIKFCDLRGNSHVVMASVLDLPYNENHFDLVTSFDVIYCLKKEDRIRAMNEFYRVLKPGGLLALNVPAYGWLFSQHDRVIGTEHRFTRADLSRLIKSSGFKVEKISYWNAILFPPAVGVRLVKKWLIGLKPRSDLKKTPKIFNRFLTGVLFLEADMLKRMDFPFGLSILAIAKKDK